MWIKNLFLFIWAYTPVFALTDDLGFLTANKGDEEHEYYFSIISILFGEKKIQFFSFPIKQPEKKMILFRVKQISDMGAFDITDEKANQLETDYKQAHLAEVLNERRNWFGQLEAEYVRDSLHPDNARASKEEDMDVMRQFITQSEGELTGQAVLAAKKVINTPFIVIIADDYYGKEGFKAVHEYLVNGGKSCMAGFVLKNTLSDNGGDS